MADSSDTTNPSADRRALAIKRLRALARFAADTARSLAAWESDLEIESVYEEVGKPMSDRRRRRRAAMKGIITGGSNPFSIAAAREIFDILEPGTSEACEERRHNNEKKDDRFALKCRMRQILDDMDQKHGFDQAKSLVEDMIEIIELKAKCGEIKLKPWPSTVMRCTKSPAQKNTENVVIFPGRPNV